MPGWPTARPSHRIPPPTWRPMPMPDRNALQQLIYHRMTTLGLSRGRFGNHLSPRNPSKVLRRLDAFIGGGGQRDGDLSARLAEALVVPRSTINEAAKATRDAIKVQAERITDPTLNPMRSGPLNAAGPATLQWPGLLTLRPAGYFDSPRIYRATNTSPTARSRRRRASRYMVRSPDSSSTTRPTTPCNTT